MRPSVAGNSSLDGWHVTKFIGTHVEVTMYRNGDIILQMHMSRVDFIALLDSKSRLLDQFKLLDNPHSAWPWDRLATYTRVNGSNPILIDAVANKAAITHSSAIDLIATWKV